MKWYIEDPYPKSGVFNAGNKARMDIANIARESGFCPLRILAPYIDVVRTIDRAKRAFFLPITYFAWLRALKKVRSGDTILLQIPVLHKIGMIATILSLVRKRGVKIIAFLHDLSLLRNVENIEEIDIVSPRSQREIRLLNCCCDKVIVHNLKMKKLMVERLGFSEDRLVVLGIFDYLQDSQDLGIKQRTISNKVVFAGNLIESKSGFLYTLPSSPDFELYGDNYQERETRNNVQYHGVFLTEDLPKVMAGSYGLVWDGNSCQTCSGNYGAYLRYNSPHKISLYLSSGLPVIIWNEAALADFVLERGCGIAINSLNKLSEVLRSVNAERYAEMKNAAEAEGVKLRNGFYTKRALDECLLGLE